MPQRLYVVDGNSNIYRAFYARMPPLMTREGIPTKAIYGFTQMLLKLVREERPDYLAVVFDTDGCAYRRELFPEYKANRDPMPADLAPQIPLIHEIVEAFRIPVIALASTEADDVIASIAALGREAGLDVVMVSADKDLMQLVDEHVTMLDTMKARKFGPAEVEAKLGVRPDQVVDLLALTGDKVDNVPGVPGIGLKTAAKLLADHGSLDGVYAAIDTQKGKRRDNLEAHEVDAYLSQQLVQLRTHLEVPVTAADLAVREPDRGRLSELFGRLEFKDWQREYFDAGPGPLSRAGFALVGDHAGLTDLVARLREAGSFSMVAMTADPAPLTAPLVGLAFAIDPSEAWYVPLGGSGSLLDPIQTLPPDAVLTALGPLLADPTVAKGTDDAKALVEVLAQAGLSLGGLDFGVELASYVVDPGRNAHGLAAIAFEQLRHEMIAVGSLNGATKKGHHFDLVPLDEARDYACERAQVVAAVRPRLAKELEKTGVTQLLAELELPLARVLADMERVGVAVDVPALKRLSAELGSEAAKLEQEAHDLAGGAFNLGSPAQVGEVLFERLKLPVKKRTRTGYSTDSEVLEELGALHPLPGKLLAWRKLSKLKSTYTDALPEQVHPLTGRIHTTFNQAVAATGRLSSTEPNLQNIPIRTPQGQRVRECFVAEAGNVLLAADYSQIELRILAHLCGDERLKQAFLDGADVHTRTATELFEVAEDSVTRGQRALAKTMNFAILYGMSAWRLAREQDISREEADATIDRYFARYPRILAWKEELLEEARQSGQVTTLMGRVRQVPDLRARSSFARGGAERIAVNTPVQGSAADLIKKAMIDVHPLLAERFPRAHMLLQVHDELVFELPESEVGAVTELVRSVMGGVVELAVPLEVNVAHGANWLAAH